MRWTFQTTGPLSFLFIFFIYSSSAPAAPGAISSALAGAGRSSVDLGESYVLNPASVAHLRGSGVSFGTSSLAATDNSQGSSHHWHLSLNENSPDSIVGTSIYLNQSAWDASPDGTMGARQTQDGWFSIANFVMPLLTVGLSYHLRQTQTLDLDFQEHNFGLGFIWTPLEDFGFGFSLQNFRPCAKDIPAEFCVGSNAGVGLLYLGGDSVRLRLDYSQKSHPLLSQAGTEWAFGLENLMTPWALARVGVAQEQRQDKSQILRYAFGLGFAGPRFGIHYGYQQYQIAQRGSEHSVDLIIPFW